VFFFGGSNNAVLAARVIELNHAVASLDALKNRFYGAAGSIAPAEVGAAAAPVLGVGPDESLILVRESLAENGVQHLHFEQRFRNIPVWGNRVVVSRRQTTGQFVGLRGSVVLGITNDVQEMTPNISAQDALQRVQASFRLSPPSSGSNATAINSRFMNESTRLVIFVRPSDLIAKLSYEVTFFAILNSETGAASRPVFFIDAKTGETIYQYEGLTTADGTGPGGNQKTGHYRYGPGQTFPPFSVTEAGGGDCSLSNPLVDTENLNEGTVDIGLPFKYRCYENTTKQINGAFAPMNDAHFFGAIIYNMWKDWYGTAPISQKLTMRVHYGNQFENAFWNGKAMYFGDGQTLFYPLVALDVTSHEIAHGYTEQHSNLTYSKQSGGINEAFSDMAGETAEFYRNSGSPPDFLVGPSIFKQANAALRYMCDPTKDGRSIASAKNYYDGLDVHYSSGVFNKAFCSLAKTTGWDARKAFHVFQVANRDFWTPSTNFQTGAEGVRDAAQAQGYSTNDVCNAFAAVDISITCAPAAKNYLYTTLRIITKNASRGCAASDWSCMTNLCKQDLGQTAWRGWGGCHSHSGDYICNFECGQVRQLF
jgi:Zn-dependent metalloprotease